MLQRESPLIHVCSLRIARTFLARSRTTLKTRTSLPLHVGGGGRAWHRSTTTGLSLSLSLFLKRERERNRERRRPLGQISAWFTTIPGQGTFFIPHTLCLVRVTIAPCLEVLCTKCHYFSSTTSSRYVISCCIVSVELNNSRYFERGGEEERDSFFDPRLFEKEEFFFYGRVIVDGCILFWRMGDIISWGSNEDSSFGVEKVFNFWECSIYMYSETYFNIFFFLEYYSCTW